MLILLDILYLFDFICIFCVLLGKLLAILLEVASHGFSTTTDPSSSPCKRGSTAYNYKSPSGLPPVGSANLMVSFSIRDTTLFPLSLARQH